MKTVSKASTLGVDTALRIETNESTVYHFRSLLSRNEAHEMISARSEASKKSLESLYILDTLYTRKSSFGLSGLSLPTIKIGGGRK